MIDDQSLLNDRQEIVRLIVPVEVRQTRPAPPRPVKTNATSEIYISRISQHSPSFAGSPHPIKTSRSPGRLSLSRRSILHPNHSFFFRITGSIIHQNHGHMQGSPASNDWYVSTSPAIVSHPLIVVDRMRDTRPHNWAILMRSLGSTHLSRVTSSIGFIGWI